MIKCIIINSCTEEYVPDHSFFNKWISAFEFKGQAEVTIKIVDENEMRNFNILYRNQDKIPLLIERSKTGHKEKEGRSAHEKKRERTG